VLRLSSAELTMLAPRLRPYLSSPRPAWPEVVDAADWLRGELGVSQSLWGEACLAMGREQAAIAIGIVSAKPAGHFRSTPGGYFHGIMAKAKAGELNLARTVWGLRQTATSGSRRGFSHPRSPLSPNCPTGPECGPGDRPPPAGARQTGIIFRDIPSEPAWGPRPA
jgi:replication initiation protein RepC